MAKKKRDRKLEADLAKLLEPHYPGMGVRAEHSARWDRMCATFTWEGFAGLLPEERFQRLVRVIPEDFRQERLAGYVWLELEPEQSIDDFLKLPRSEDVEPREHELYEAVMKVGVFDALAERLGDEPTKICGGSLAELEVILKQKKMSKRRAVGCKLMFIRHGAFCDCQVLLTVRAVLADLYDKK